MLKMILIILLFAGFVHGDDVQNGIDAAKIKDYKTASKLFQKACDDGKIKGCYILGLCMMRELVLNKTALKHQSYIKKPVTAVSPAGAITLGFLYYHGDGVKQESLKAVNLFQKACDGGDASGCNNLGAVYANGFRDKQSYEYALKFFSKACDMKYEEGCKNYVKLKQR